MLAQVKDLASENRFDYLLVESTGISEPMPVATTFDFRDESGFSLSDVAELDTMVTVVDAANLIANYSSTDFLKDRGESIGEGDQRTLVDLLVDQIEFANVILLNKIDLVSSEDLEIVRSIVRGLNVKAKILETKMAQVNLDQVMGTKTFDLVTARNHPMWAQELFNHKEHVPETEEYGITSFVYRAREPFDPIKLHAFFNQQWPGIFRAKGFFWLANRPDYVGQVSQAGSFVRHQGSGRWWATVQKERWPRDEKFLKMIAQHWLAGIGDRRQEIVFIGLKSVFQQDDITRRLNECLVHDYVIEKDPLPYENDPFPAWFQESN